MLKKFCTIPTLFTLLRIILTPVIMYLLYIQAWIYALLFFMIAALTDILDGFCARTLQQETEFGSYLDPVADKLLLIGCYSILLSLPETRQFVPCWFMIILIMREIAILGGAAVILYIGAEKLTLTPNFWGKLTTFVHVIFLSFIIYHVYLGITIDSLVITSFWLVIALCMVISSMLYIIRGAKRIWI